MVGAAIADQGHAAAAARDAMAEVAPWIGEMPVNEAPTFDYAGRTLLHYAAFEDNAERARELIAAGADLNAHDKRGYTPLHFAAQ